MRDLQQDAENPFLSPLALASDENIEQFVNETVQRGTARNSEARYGSSNQSTGPVEGKVIATDGKAAAFALEIQDDADPVHILVLG